MGSSSGFPVAYARCSWARLCAIKTADKIKVAHCRKKPQFVCFSAALLFASVTVLHSGGLRFEPHLDRKLSAIEAVERKRMHVGANRLTSKMPK
jgi:hypothetical protein